MTVERITLIVFVLCASLVYIGVSWSLLSLIAGIAGLLWVVANVIEGSRRV